MPLYDGPIIDTHHHIWHYKDVGWLQPPVTPKMFGDYFQLRRDFPIEEWMNDIVPEGVTKSVHVTANWGPDRAVDETKWLQSIADRHGFPHAFSAQVDLTDPEIESRLKAHKQYPNTRGVRHQLYWDSHPLRRCVSRPDLCNTPEFRRGFALLEKYDLHFELQVFGSQAAYAAELVKAFPGVRFILLHSGMLTDWKSPEIVEQWREGLMLLASFPNVHVKISGLSMFSFGWTIPQLRQVIRDSIQIFGAGRTIYGSNFPLEKVAASYADLMAGYRKVLSEYSVEDQRRIFHDNAVNFYRI
jgi:predicted TIM-barrel fold metal-dependent hydrolase